MEKSCTYIDYEQTGYFSTIVTDYLKDAEAIRPFYKHTPTLEGIENAIEERKLFPYQRSLLVHELREQYAGLPMNDVLKHNIELLLKENTYTITTAHQPNIFTGPLYFIYKILHAIKLAATLNEQLSHYHFVPVFYMGSEDADLDELGYININGTKYQWNTTQTGAVGRMKVDKAFIQLIDSIQGQVGVLEYGDEIISIFKQAYTLEKTIQQATLELVNELFGKYGLIVLIPDNAKLKTVFHEVVYKELQEQFSSAAVATTIQSLNKNYKVQAGGRDLNLFYLLDNARERIEITESGFKLANSAKSWTKEEIHLELAEHPERFSANVILRGVFQEMILPNVVFIGGGGELAYWLELKSVFEQAQVPYPVLVLRNSFLLVNAKNQTLLQKLNVTITQIFQKEDAILNYITQRETSNQLSIKDEIAALKNTYQTLKGITSKIDPTLADHTAALETKAVYRLQELEKKMLRAEKRKLKEEGAQLHQLKESLFPKTSLQERTENISSFYGKYGAVFIEKLLQHSLGLEQQFTVWEI